MEETLSVAANIGFTALEIISPVIVSLLGWGVAELIKLIRTRVKNEMWAGMLARLTDSAYTTVTSLNQTVVDAMREARADGKLTESDVSMLRNAALADLKSYWGPRGLTELQKVLGLTESETQRVIESKIESAVAGIKAEKAGAAKKS